MKDYSRRGFVKWGVAGTAALFLPTLGSKSGLWASTGETPTSAGDPHFFLQILIPGGADSTYLFDARPLALTKDGKLQNYLGEEPSPWVGKNGQTTWVTRLVKRMEAYRDDFSILNGVLMAQGFDGHDQNMNFLLTGNPFGGDSFIPQLNQLAKNSPSGSPNSSTSSPKCPIDALQLGFLFANIQNLGSTVPISSQNVQTLVTKLRSIPPLSLENPLFRFIRSRIEANSQSGNGRFSAGGQAMLSAFDKAPELASVLASIDPSGLVPKPDPTQPPTPVPPEEVKSFIPIVAEFFRKGVSRSALIVLSGNYDAHSPDVAKQQPMLLPSAIDDLVFVLDYLKNNPYDSQRSLLDVTTFMIGTEFSRTMKQVGSPVDHTGTDHNPLSNSILIGGKGIQGGYVVGATDQQTSNEKLSRAHLTLDEPGIKMMGRPFDFITLKPKQDLPEIYSAKDYLSMASVVNSIYSLFGVPDKYNRLFERNGQTAPVLQGLLKS